MKVRKIWIAVLCVVIGVVWWVVRPQSLVHVARHCRQSRTDHPLQHQCCG